MLIRSDAQHIPLADESVQCCITSPPYWGLRKYSGDQRWQYGLEPTIDLYVQHTVEVFREVRRVLRKDGVCFLNIGDSYATGAGSARIAGGNCFGKSNSIVDSGDFPASQPNRMPQAGLKPKDLCLIPARVAIALQADGWWVRSDIIWSKPNPMPESVTDRPTDAYEHIFVLTKSARYYWDAEAVKEDAVAGWNGAKFTDTRESGVYADLGQGARNGDSMRRNLRNVWSFPTQPYSGSHFATFPEELVIRCIQACTSERGCCARCGAPRQRIVETTVVNITKLTGTGQDCEAGTAGRAGEVETVTKGWRPTCTHTAPTIPCLVYDPFAGSGTVGLVAFSMGRRFILSDLAYQDLQRQRLPAMALVPDILSAVKNCT